MYCNNFDSLKLIYTIFLEPIFFKNYFAIICTSVPQPDVELVPDAARYTAVRPQTARLRCQHDCESMLFVGNYEKIPRHHVFRHEGKEKSRGAELRVSS